MLPALLGLVVELLGSLFSVKVFRGTIVDGVVTECTATEIGGFILSNFVLLTLALAWGLPSGFRSPRTPRALAAVLTIALVAIAIIQFARSMAGIGVPC